MTDLQWENEAQEVTCAWMFGAHPHALAEYDWPRFVAMVRAKAGYEVPEETIRQALAETPNEDKEP